MYSILLYNIGERLIGKYYCLLPVNSTSVSLCVKYYYPASPALEAVLDAVYCYRRNIAHVLRDSGHARASLGNDRVQFFTPTGRNRLHLAGASRRSDAGCRYH